MKRVICPRCGGDAVQGISRTHPDYICCPNCPWSKPDDGPAPDHVHTFDHYEKPPVCTQCGEEG